VRSDGVFSEAGSLGRAKRWRVRWVDVEGQAINAKCVGRPVADQCERCAGQSAAAMRGADPVADFHTTELVTERGDEEVPDRGFGGGVDDRQRPAAPFVDAPLLTGDERGRI